MRNVFITTIAAMAFAGTAMAQTVSGEVSLDVAENAAGDYAVTTGFELGVNAEGLATVDLDFSATDGGAVTLDNWTVGTTVGAVGIAIGDDNGLFPEAEGEQTLTFPAMAESVKVSVGDAAVALGFTDWSTDATDISNVQGAYTFNVAALSITAAADYNLNTENTVLGAGVSGLELGGVATLGGVVTYDVDAELFGYEAVAGAYGATAYLNGDSNDALQNVGGEYVYMLGGAELSAGVNYDINAEEFAPTAGISFSF
jgi:hypothetical protein